MGLMQQPPVPALLNNSSSSQSATGAPSSPLARRYTNNNNSSASENSYMNAGVMGFMIQQEQMQQQQQQPLNSVRLPALNEADHHNDDRDESEPLIPPRTTSKTPGIRTVHPQTPPRGATRGEEWSGDTRKVLNLKIGFRVVLTGLEKIPSDNV